MEEFFAAANIAVRLQNPDRVIKPIDGDYNPPEETSLPDNHCYPCWYNGHGIDIGRLYKGYWMYVKPGWYYGCGEFGTEGLDPVSVMRVAAADGGGRGGVVAGKNRWGADRKIPLFLL